MATLNYRPCREHENANNMKKLLLISASIALLLTACQPKIQQATLIVQNANIWTGNSQQPQANALAISGDTIVAVGSNEEIKKFKGASTKIIDAQGHFVTPGFIDSHVHLLDGGFTLSSVQLRDAKTPEEFSQRIEAFTKTVPKGTWIIGSDWDGSEWGELPSKHWIDSLTPDHPVFLARFDGHIGLANSLAMKLAGINNDISDVEGGVILRDDANELTGIFKDNAMTLITSKIPTPTDEQFDTALDNAMKYFASNGVTSVHHVWYPTDYDGYQAGFERAHKNNRLTLRIYSLDSLENWSALGKKIAADHIDDKWLKINGVKGVLDGALGSHTAAFNEPFTDDPTDRGSLMLPEKNLYNWASKADKLDIQVAIHAIGDRANHILLNTFKTIASENGEKDRRFRIEHAQHISPSDIARFSELDVIACMQPYHAIDDGRWAEKIIGPERIKTTYAFKSLINANTKVAFSSDWPVAPASVLEGIYAAVTRRTLDDKNPGGWVPEQKVSVEDALVAYTKNGAYASFEEKIKGTLEVGKLADFVIISEDITKVDPVRIKDLKILETYVGGKSVFRRTH